MSAWFLDSELSTCNNQIMKCYGCSVSLYDTAVNKLNRRDLSNTASRERLPKKSQVTWYYLQKDYQAAKQVGAFQL